MSAATRSTGRAAAPPGAERRPPAPVAAPPAPQPPNQLVDIDRYAVFDNGIIGYVEVIPPLFICYSGHPYPTAVEVAQVFDFAQAVRCVRDAAPHSHDHGRSAA